MPDTFLIQTKLHRPPVASIHVRRESLQARLHKELGRPLTLVCAPAGYGKSTLVGAWLESSGWRSAWLSLDDHDNDLHLFLTYFLAAIQTLFPEECRKIETILKSDELPPLPILASSLINDLDDIGQDFILAIDDYHLIQNDSIHELLGEILKHPPDTLHLVLIGRIDPPLSLAALRARGMMAEIRAKDLRFSHKEISDFFNQILETRIDEIEIAKIEEKTEGWIAGLYLAALSIRQWGDQKNTISNYVDSNNFVAEYLVEEILSKQTSTLLQFLIRTSILDRLCGPLCDAVCNPGKTTDSIGESGQDFLLQLKKENLFMISLDHEDTWFRYHHLFQSLLKRKLTETLDPEEISTLHKNASDWLAEHGYHEEAIRHALAADEVAQAVEFVGIARHELMNSDQWRTLERWLNLFSPKEVQQHPHLVLLRCWIDYYLWYRLDLLVEDLELAATLLEASSLGRHEVHRLEAEVAAINCHFAYWKLEPEHGIELAEQVLRDSPDEHECVRSTALAGLGPLWQMIGKAHQGERLIWDHMEDWKIRGTSSRLRLLLYLCITYWPEADHQKQLQFASGLLDKSRELNLAWCESFAHYFLGAYYYERNDPSEAVKHLEAVYNDPYLYPIQNVTHCSILLSLCYQALALPDLARTVVESLVKLTIERGNSMFNDLFTAFRAELDLRQGNITQAEDWARTYVLPDPHSMQRYYNSELTYIKVLLAQDTSESRASAAELLDTVHALLQSTHHRRLMIDVLGMQALLADVRGKESIAFENLKQALALAEPGNIVRPILDLGANMIKLLEKFGSKEDAPEFVGNILAASNSGKTGADQHILGDQGLPQSLSSARDMLEPLSKREIEILKILETGSRNQDIAEKLYISPETVKRHLYNIYQKLGVKNRQKAITRARSLGIL